MKKVFILIAAIAVMATSCKTTSNSSKSDGDIAFPDAIKIEGVALNPEGIAYNKNDHTFLLSSLNAAPIIKVNLDGTFTPFTSGEKFPLSTAGLEIDYKRNRLLVAGFNGMELMDKDAATKGTAFLRIYNLKTGVIEKDINLSYLAPDAETYFANDITVDANGNVYISDWNARVIYKVDMDGNASLFWTNETGVSSGPNGLDFHPDGYLLVSLVAVNGKGLYTDFGLVKIPVNDAKAAKLVEFSNPGFTGFDGMVLAANGNIIGVTNDGKMPGGNTLIELSGKKGWTSAKVVNTKAIKGSTTVALTPGNKNFVINQDFSNPMATTWTIEQIKF